MYLPQSVDPLAISPVRSVIWELDKTIAIRSARAVNGRPVMSTETHEKMINTWFADRCWISEWIYLVAERTVNGVKDIGSG